MLSALRSSTIRRIISVRALTAPGSLDLPPVTTKDVDRHSMGKPSLEPMIRKSDSAVQARLLSKFVPGLLSRV